MPQAAQTLVPTVLFCAVLGACQMAPTSAGSERTKNAEAVDLQNILVLDRPPEVIVRTTADMQKARRSLSVMDPNELAGREGARMARANALPWLSGSTEGRAFLDEKLGRVLVRGTPAAFCPVALTESGPKPVAELATDALNTCLEIAGPDCGCRVIAAGSVLLVPRDQVAYATGVSARIKARALGLDGLLVAEDAPNGGVLLRDVNTVVGKLERSGDDAVTLTFGESIYRGTARKVGFRRGRLAERIYAKDPNGNRLSLLIGFGPVELSELAGAWLAWPPDA